MVAIYRLLFLEQRFTSAVSLRDHGGYNIGLGLGCSSWTTMSDDEHMSTSKAPVMSEFT